MPNAITLLKKDHASVKRLLRELNETNGTRRREELVAQIEQQVKTHSQIEEEVFYPAFKSAAERKRKSEGIDLFYEAAEEHHIVDMVLPALKAANTKSHEFEAKAKVLKELIEHHIKEEEGKMFTTAKQLFSEDQLTQLGELMQQRRESIEAMWDHPLLRSVKKLQSAAQKLMPTKVKTMKATVIGKAMNREARTR